MALKVLSRHSLKTRITLSTLAIFLLGLWSLSFYASQMLRRDMERLLGEHQFSTVSLIAAKVNHELADRLRALESVANTAVRAMASGPADMQDFINQQSVLQTLFNGGVIAYDVSGREVADFPMSAQRSGASYLSIDVVATALTQGRASIGRPLHFNKLRTPIFGMAAPIRDAQGRIIGALTGVINLGLPSFLDGITESRYGTSGYYLLEEPEDRLIITGTDKRRVMQALPAPGVNALIDRHVQGYDETGVTVNPMGVEVLASARRIPVAGWFLVGALPTTEAFAPIRAMQQRMLLATLFLTLLAGGLTWWILRRQLSPLLAAARTLATLSDRHQPLQALTIGRQDEIGQLISGFNRLLGELGQREALLQQVLDTSSVAIFLVDREGRITQANRRMAEMFGLALEDLPGREYVELIHPSEREIGRQKMLDLLNSAIDSVALDRRYWRADQSEFWGHLTGQRFFGAQGEELGLVGVIADITERKQAEASLRVAATAFESQEAMTITDANQVILKINHAFTRVTGYSEEDAIGRTPALLKSGRQDKAFYQAMWAAINEQGFWQGEIWNRRKNGEIYPERLAISAVYDETGQVSNYVAAFSDITVHKQAQDEIQQLAFTDPLTGLPNRRLLLDRLKHSLLASHRSKREGALLFIDLDNFKTLNDTLGHDMGDLLLKQVTQRLVGCVREGDTVARLGGDEFVVMLENLSENPRDAALQAEGVGEKILAALNQPYPLADYEHHSSASIGLTLFGDKRETVDELLKRADLAMYSSKTAGRNTLRFFDPQMQTLVSTRAALEADLREALQKNQFTLYFQAQVMGSRRMTGAEVLLRWQHPQRGMVSPAEFIPVAEETGLILAVGHWVLTTACSQLAAWAGDAATAGLTLAVNVSARQFHHRDFVSQVLEVLERTGANPQRLKLELTESMLAVNVEEIITKMSALKAHGVGFSLDDFGTGYSSLSYLKLLPLDQLKIDQGFVRDILIDPNDAAISKMVVALADSLGLAVIAEGVETEAQRDFLAGQGCHAYQGYLFGRPLPLPSFEEFVSRF